MHWIKSDRRSKIVHNRFITFEIHFKVSMDWYQKLNDKRESLIRKIDFEQLLIAHTIFDLNL